MAENLKNNSISYYIHSIVAIVIMICFKFIPAVDPITPLGMEIVGIMIGLIYAYCTVDNIWPSILALVLLGLSGYCKVSEAFIKAAGNDTILFILFLLFFGGIIACTGIGKEIAERVTLWKIFKGRPWFLTVGILVAAFLLSSIIGSIPIILIFWSIIYGICETVGFSKHDKWPTYIIFGMALICAQGGLFLPFQVPVTGQLAVYKALDPGFSLSYPHYLCFSSIMGMCLIASYTMVGKFIVRPKMDPILNYQSEPKKDHLNFEHKIAIVLIISLVILLMLPGLLPQCGFKTFLQSIGNTGMTALVVGAALLIRKNGKPVFNIKTISDRGVLWGMLFMVATAVTISTAMTSKETGVTQFINQLLAPVLSNTSPYIFLVLITVTSIILTNFINNSVVGIMMLTILFSFGDGLGVNSTVGFILISYASCLGFMLPSASPSAALLYGNRDWLDSKSIIKMALIVMLMMGLIFSLIGIPLGNIIF